MHCSIIHPLNSLNCFTTATLSVLYFKHSKSSVTFTTTICFSCVYFVVYRVCLRISDRFFVASSSLEHYYVTLFGLRLNIFFALSKNSSHVDTYGAFTIRNNDSSSFLFPPFLLMLSEVTGQSTKNFLKETVRNYFLVISK